jgi:SAM-dependent methyltransferase
MAVCGCAIGSVDFKLAATATREAADARKLPNVSFAKATIFDEGLERESFDEVLAFNILHLLEDAPQALRRIGEMLRPGVLLVSVTPCRASQALGDYRISGGTTTTGHGAWSTMWRLTEPRLSLRYGHPAVSNPIGVRHCMTPALAACISRPTAMAASRIMWCGA